MALILCVDVSGKQGLVALSIDGLLIDQVVNNEPMQHAAFLQPAIKNLLERNNKTTRNLQAIAISNGPGSYTGLRVGLASVKGLCFALNIPLIAINSLQLLALATSNCLTTHLASAKAGETIPNFTDIEKQTTAEHPGEILYCPMIDARRMEVFYGLYNGKNSPLIKPGIAILDEYFLSDYIAGNRVVFTGSGSEKLKPVLQNPNAYFLPETPVATAFCQLAFNFYRANNFTEPVSAEPFYYKAFYDTKKITKK